MFDFFNASFDALLSLATTAAPATPPAGATDAATTDPNAAPGWWGYMGIVPWLMIGVLFYLIFIAPQRRKQKETQQMINAIEKGDRVVTIGGMLGTVVNVQDNEVTLKVDETSNAKVRFQRSAIARIEPRAGDTLAKSDKK